MVKMYNTVCAFLSVFTIIGSVNGNEDNVKSKPNIVMIVADDLGWDDVSFHGSSQVLTPNIDMLAYTGVALERYYSHCVCTPSRAAILTGKFAHTLGMNGYPFTYAEDRGIPLTEKLLPEYLKDIGYATHLVGKWHVGLSRDQYLPTSRGFDSHFGFRGGTVDYYEYVAEETWVQGSVSGFDLYHNKTLARDVEGYLTEVLTEKATEIIRNHDDDHDPLFLMVTYSAPHAGNDGAILQAPPETVRAMRHIVNPNRRIFAAMIKNLDDGVGTIFKTLSEEGMLNNTIIVFISDNGGMPIGKSMNYASNWPLRGSKITPFEGGIRVVGLLWTQTFNITRHRFTGNFHAVDWLPTLLKSVGEDAPVNIDGVDLWSQIFQEKSTESATRHDLYEIYSCAEDSFGAIVSGDFKLIVGNVTREYSKHLGRDLRGLIGDGPDYENTIQNSEVYRSLTKQNKDFLNLDWEELRKGIKVNCNVPLEGKQLCNTGYEGNEYCLYNIKNDSCELIDVSEDFPDVLEDLLARLRAEMDRAVKRPCPVFRDPRGLPSLHNYTWTTWANDIDTDNVDLNKISETVMK